MAFSITMTTTFSSLRVQTARFAHAMHSTSHSFSRAGYRNFPRNDAALAISRRMSHPTYARLLHRHVDSRYLSAAIKHTEGYSKGGRPLHSTGCNSGRNEMLDVFVTSRASCHPSSFPRSYSGSVIISEITGTKKSRLEIKAEKGPIHRPTVAVYSSTSQPAELSASFQENVPSQSSGNLDEIPCPNPIFLPPTSAYVHIPFCRRRCHYCDFPITTVGLRGDANPRAMQRMEEYVGLVIREIRTAAAQTKAEAAAAAFNGQKNLPVNSPTSTPFIHESAVSESTPSPRHSGSASATSAPASHRPPYPTTALKTVFFGGGTPSLLPPHLLSLIIDELRLSFGIEEAAEISMEADPGTFDQSRMREYVMGGGVNRVSVGVQSLSDEVLRVCGRTHSAEEAVEAIAAVKAAGVDNWSVDLMSGLPYQSLSTWNDSLLSLLSHHPPHISLYDLQVEPNTPFARWFTPSLSPLPSDSLAADMYRHASLILRSAGYDHYEISNYATSPAYRCSHNLTYWKNLPYHGFGLGATSYVGGRRVGRPKDMVGYSAWVNRYEASGGASLAGDADVDAGTDQLQDTLMLGLRLSQGLSMPSLAGRFGERAAVAVAGQLALFVDRGLVEVVTESGTVVNAIESAINERNAAAANKVDDWEASETMGDRNGAVRESHEESENGNELILEQGWDEDRRKGKVSAVRKVCMRLSDPEGFLVSNEIIATVFHELEKADINIAVRHAH